MPASRTGWIERPAKLFEAGEYPDKNISVTEDDLDRIVLNATETNIAIEHMPTPFDGGMGVVGNLYRKGKSLFGTMKFPPYMWELMEATGAKKLSVGIKRSKDGLGEVSIVKSPRVASAAVFNNGGEAAFTGGIIEMSWDSLPADEVEELLRASIGTGENDYCVYIKALFESGAVIEKEDTPGSWYYPFTISGGKITLGSPEQWEQVWVKKQGGDSLNTNKGGQIMPETFTEDQVKSIASEAAKAAAKEAEDRVRVEFTGVVDELKGEIKSLTVGFNTNRADELVKKWQAEGKIADEAVDFAKGIVLGGGETAETYVKFMDAQPGAKAVLSTEDAEIEEATNKIFSGLGVAKKSEGEES